jgi:hypothetical protein
MNYLSTVIYIGEMTLFIQRTAIHSLWPLTQMPLTRICSFAPKCATKDQIYLPP